MSAAVEPASASAPLTTESASRAASLRGALVVCVGSLLAGAALRLLYLAQPWRIDWATFAMFLGDEGALGLMGRHILRGARPLFYYGGAYLGALDAYLAAVAFAFFGDSLTTLRAVPSCLAFAAVPLAFVLGRQLGGSRAGLLAAALMAVPSRYVFEWGSMALIGFFLHVSFVLLMVILSLHLLRRVTRPALAAFGVTCGLAVWNNLLAGAYVAVCIAALAVWAPWRRRDLAVLAIAGIIGLTPLLYANVVQPLATVRAIARKVHFTWSLTKKFVDDDESRPRSYRAISMLEVLGVQPRKDGDISPVGSLGAVLLAVGFLGTAVHAARIWRRDPSAGRSHALIVILALLSVAQGSGGFAGQPVGRYQLPLYGLLAAAAAAWIVRSAPRIAVAAVAIVVIANGVSIAAPSPWDGSPLREVVIDTLHQRGLTRGYTAGPMYDLIFRSHEEIIAVPLDHSRYLAYEEQVAGAHDIFYLYRSNQEHKPAHHAFLDFLSAEGIAHQRVDVGEYHVFYDFTPRDRLSGEAIAAIRDRFRHAPGASGADGHDESAED